MKPPSWMRTEQLYRPVKLLRSLRKRETMLTQEKKTCISCSKYTSLIQKNLKPYNHVCRLQSKHTYIILSCSFQCTCCCVILNCWLRCMCLFFLLQFLDKVKSGVPSLKYFTLLGHCCARYKINLSFFFTKIS